MSVQLSISIIGLVGIRTSHFGVNIMSIKVLTVGVTDVNT